ncbi:MAG: OB-fold nucleic acid binding domain-containing protein [Anaerolineae bacterium]
MAFASIVVLLMVVAGCECAPEPAATAKPLPAVATTVPTSVPTATPTPFPKDTQVPTDTSEPTRTPAPSDTPEPTLTPTPSATATPAVVLTRIGDITAARAGEEVTVEADVVGAASFSDGFKFTLDDGTGRITLLMWRNFYDDCWDAPQINLGARVRATGEVGEYEGKLQIGPSFGGDVEVIEGAAPWATPRDIGSLSGGDAGQRVMIEGHVIRVEGSEGWAKIFVGDDTGEVVVFIWSNVLARIPSNTKLGVEGTQVRVVGTLEVYESNLEVVPALPYDVVVLE